MELEFSVKDQQHRLSVVAHEGRTELVFDDNAMPIMGSLQDIVKYHQEHNIVATLLYADEETKAFLETLAKVFQHLGCKTELRVLWQLGEYNLEEMYKGYVVATYGAPNRTDITKLELLHARIMWAANLLTDNDPGSLIEFYRSGFSYGSTHELVQGIKNMATAISYCSASRNREALWLRTYAQRYRSTTLKTSAKNTTKSEKRSQPGYSEQNI